MDEISKEYSLLFNGITDTIKELERVVLRLKMLQMQAEELSLADEGSLRKAAIVTEMSDLVGEIVMVEKSVGSDGGKNTPHRGGRG